MRGDEQIPVDQGDIRRLEQWIWDLTDRVDRLEALVSAGRVVVAHSDALERLGDT